MSNKSLSHKIFDDIQPCYLWLIDWPYPKHNFHMVWKYWWLGNQGLYWWYGDGLGGCPSSLCRSFIFFLHEAVADCAFLLCLLKEFNSIDSTSARLDLTNKNDLSTCRTNNYMFWQSLDILFSCKSLHMKENRFAPALGQIFMGHRVSTVPWTCQTYTCSLPFFIAGIILELP